MKEAHDAKSPEFNLIGYIPRLVEGSEFCEDCAFVRNLSYKQNREQKWKRSPSMEEPLILPMWPMSKSS